MKKTALLLVCLSFIFSIQISAQTFSTSGIYQLGKYGEYYGASISKTVKTWNNEKVILRGITSFMMGNHWGEQSYVNKFYRFELGFESINTMISGRDFFSIINLSYVFTNSEVNEGLNSNIVRDNGVMFSFGLGARLISPVAFTARYVWGPQKGIRVGLEYGF
ncbi:MAG: hypothetical protein V1773_01870 [bacterium]